VYSAVIGWNVLSNFLPRNIFIPKSIPGFQKVHWSTFRNLMPPCSLAVILLVDGVNIYESLRFNVECLGEQEKVYKEWIGKVF